MSTKPWGALPWKADELGMWITDANGARVCDIRGWGHLTGTRSMPPENAAQLQIEMAKRIVEVMNATAVKP